jgi:hypothetical protein
MNITFLDLLQVHGRKDNIFWQLIFVIGLKTGSMFMMFPSTNSFAELCDHPI